MNLWFIVHVFLMPIKSVFEQCYRDKDRDNILDCKQIIIKFKTFEVK